MLMVWLADWLVDSLFAKTKGRKSNKNNEHNNTALIPANLRQQVS